MCSVGSGLLRRHLTFSYGLHWEKDYIFQIIIHMQKVFSQKFNLNFYMHYEAPWKSMQKSVKHHEPGKVDGLFWGISFAPPGQEGVVLQQLSARPVGQIVGPAPTSLGCSWDDRPNLFGAEPYLLLLSIPFWERHRCLVNSPIRIARFFIQAYVEYNLDHIIHV